MTVRFLLRATARGFEEDAPAGPWLALALAYAAIPALLALGEFLAMRPAIQDDARQFAFWMARWRDPALFQGDLIAAYFEQVTPLGYEAAMRPLVLAGIEPALAAALLPLPLSLMAAFFAFRLGRAFLPVPAAGLTASLLTLFFLWLVPESVPSGVPRAFAVPIFLALLDQLLRRRAFGVAIAGAALAAFYPQMALVAAGVLALSLLAWESGPRLRLDRPRLAVAGAGIAAIGLALLPFALASDAYGPTAWASEVRGDPAFAPGGRSAYFLEGSINFYLCGARSGFLPVEWGCGEAFRAGLAIAPWLALGLFLVLVLAVPAGLSLCAGRGGPAPRPTAAVGLLWRVILSASGWYILAHLLAFQLHLPSRYTQHSLRAVAMVGLGVALALALSRLLRASGRARPAVAGVLLAGAAAFVALPFVLPYIPFQNNVATAHPALHAQLAGTPPGTLVATLSPEGDNLPSFARRRTLVSPEYMIPYSRGYDAELRRRLAALAEATYASEPGPLRRLLEQWPVGLVLLAPDTYAPDAVARAWWARLEPQVAAETQAALAAGRRPVLEDLAPPCAGAQVDGFVAVDAACLRRALEAMP